MAVKKRHRLRVATGVYARDCWCCLWCGKSLQQSLKDEGNPLVLDYAIPPSRGGTNHPSNLLTCCVRCKTVRRGRAMRVFAREVGGEEALCRIQRARRRSR